MRKNIIICLIILLLSLNIVLGVENKTKEKDFNLTENLYTDFIYVIDDAFYDDVKKDKKIKTDKRLLKDDVNINSNLISHWEIDDILFFELEMDFNYIVKLNSNDDLKPNKYYKKGTNYIVSFENGNFNSLHVGKYSDVWDGNASTDGDAYGQKLGPANNYGAASILYVYVTLTNDFDSFVRFDRPYNVSEENISFYIDDMNTFTTGDVMHIHNCTGDWGETVLTWNNRWSLIDCTVDPFISINYANLNNGWNTVNVTDIVLGQTGNITYFFNASGVAGHSFKVDSKEGTNAPVRLWVNISLVNETVPSNGTGAGLDYAHIFQEENITIALVLFLGVLFFVAFAFILLGVYMDVIVFRFVGMIIFMPIGMIFIKTMSVWLGVVFLIIGAMGLMVVALAGTKN